MNSKIEKNTFIYLMSYLVLKSILDMIVICELIPFIPYQDKLFLIGLKNGMYLPANVTKLI